MSTTQSIPIGHEDPEEDIFEDLTNVESKFFAQGYKDGYHHGALHGLFEGRELGREKGFEIWEEVGFYEGWAEFYLRVLETGGAGGNRKAAKASTHAKMLLSLISTFPTSNPSAQTSTPTITLDTDIQPVNADIESRPVQKPDEKDEKDVDLPALISSIRARYRLLCSSLGVKPRLVANKDGQVDPDHLSDLGSAGAANVVEGIEGPMKGVDTRQLRF